MSTQATEHGIGQVAVPAAGTITVPEDVLRTAERLGIAEQLPQVIALSREVFGDTFVFRVMEDPELDNWTHIVVDAQVKGTVDEVLKRYDLWFKETTHHKLSHWFTVMTYRE